MTTRFALRRGLIIVIAEVYGPQGGTQARRALDTGAMTTTIRADILVRVGYDLFTLAGQTRIVTASGVETVPLLTFAQIDALGHSRSDLPVLAYTLLALATVDGVLSLDFLREQMLTIDFRAGLLTLA